MATKRKVRRGYFEKIKKRKQPCWDRYQATTPTPHSMTLNKRKITTPKNGIYGNN